MEDDQGAKSVLFSAKPCCTPFLAELCINCTPPVDHPTTFFAVSCPTNILHCLAAAEPIIAPTALQHQYLRSSVATSKERNAM
jgi:hypothetical protein